MAPSAVLSQRLSARWPASTRSHLFHTTQLTAHRAWRAPQAVRPGGSHQPPTTLNRPSPPARGHVARPPARPDRWYPAARSIEHRDRVPAKIEMYFDYIASGTCVRRHDSDGSFRQPIQNTRFPDIDGTRDGDRQAIPQAFAVMCVAQQSADITVKLCRHTQGWPQRNSGHAALIGKISTCLSNMAVFL